MAELIRYRRSPNGLDWKGERSWLQPGRTTSKTIAQADLNSGACLTTGKLEAVVSVNPPESEEDGSYEHWSIRLNRDEAVKLRDNLTGWIEWADRKAERDCPKCGGLKPGLQFTKDDYTHCRCEPTEPTT